MQGTLREVLPELGDLTAPDVYLAGDSAQVDAARAFLLAHGLPSAQMSAWTSH